MEAMPGAKAFNALRDSDGIILAVNPRVCTGVLDGVFRAAKANDAVVIFELARTECSLDGGYTGLTPAGFAAIVKHAAEKVGFREWVLHADHLTVKSKSRIEMNDLKALVDAQIDAGYTSFAVDASFLYAGNALDTREALEDNAAATVEIFEHVSENAPRGFGLEVEVGEIGKKNGQGLVLTSPEEAVTFLEMLGERGVRPHLLAIANGSSHGTPYAHGKPVEQLSIDIPLTRRVAQAIRGAGFPTRLAQHGITGTPLSFIEEQFPRGDILKGNVGTAFMNLVWESLAEKEPALYKRVYDWTLSTYGKEARDKGAESDAEVFGKYSKHAIRQFKPDVEALKPASVADIEARAFAVADAHFKAFHSQGSAEKARVFK
ncbi:fructose-bisphosphate aldolase [Candidatus Micrarchaeota archaeon CG_4_10_14_0_2_um_filter_60_11]|nr:MAG: hypothetical protein AUJ16_02900 [Candidatus Micrarchaeota archaeon CG1_02_60_51]PIN95896.1 MAG: fructose-bisphosphate aldolase [Candidatus Micrarchaeota archaeon CG10_big_fil_rev_8_21_14_0_10_60_32]PIO01925.1 MAG: fructose-bisphosphate aldolase [Candidatus Micrarchaeota archaeon CG09_land_8_20_14_0_10_60_16]PIZ90960.1 MAG: fructose-bisphosphate aldolase [Candidatus Micrarchaeota archaeon CG_4_10_14_0_2_um_filter_60_11]